MKKNDIIILLAAALYSLLFYQQSAGVNFLLFTVALQIFSLVRKPALLMNNAWIAAAVGALISAVCTALYGSGLCVLANVLSLSLMVGFSAATDSSLLFAAIYAIYSYITSWVESLQILIRKKGGFLPQAYPLRSVLMITVLPVALTFIFLNLYRSSNPLFEVFISNIRIDFISFQWILFTLGGALLMIGFFNPYDIRLLRKIDFRASDDLTSSSYNLTEKLLVVLNSEKLSGIVLLLMLNLVLLTLNLLDLQFLFSSEALPAGLTYSQVVHQGVYTLIVSIVFAIAIILYYFRGGMNFYKDNRFLKLLAYVWILQNALLIATCIAKNSLYIEEYSLTYKRIGVYVYLVLALIGLFVTLIKILYTKSNWFLLRKSSWAFYTLLILSVLVNWDLLITRYNLNNSDNPDKAYLLSLSSTVLPELIEYESSNHHESQSYAEQQAHSNYLYELNDKKERFHQEWQELDWQSWNYEAYKISQQLSAIQEPLLK